MSEESGIWCAERWLDCILVTMIGESNGRE